MKKIKVKKLTEDAKIDSPAYFGDAGYDVYTPISISLKPFERYAIPLGLALEFSKSLVCLVQGKSGLAKKYGIDTIGNVIDSSYRGEIHAQIVNVSNSDLFLEKGTKVAQLIFLHVSTPEIEIIQENLQETNRGSKKFGSSGI